MLKIDGVTHWSIPVNDLAESIGAMNALLDRTAVIGVPVRPSP